MSIRRKTSDESDHVRGPIAFPHSKSRTDRLSWLLAQSGSPFEMPDSRTEAMDISRIGALAAARVVGAIAYRLSRVLRVRSSPWTPPLSFLAQPVLIAIAATAANDTRPSSSSAGLRSSPSTSSR